MVSYTKPFEAIDAVIQKAADFALIDGLTILANDTLMKNDKLEIRQLININQYYGVIMAGKAERLSNCINMYMQSNKYEIERKAGSHYGKLWNVSWIFNLVLDWVIFKAAFQGAVPKIYNLQFNTHKTKNK